MEIKSDFLKRVIEKIPANKPSNYHFDSWKSGRPTSEGLGLLPMPGIDGEKLFQCVMDVDHYVGNIAHVVECRTIDDSNYSQPESVRFYQKIKIPVLGDVHHELVMQRYGEHKGYQVIGWSLLEKETDALNKKQGMRSQYNDGCWLFADGIVGYGLSSAPKKDDVGFLKWKAMTAGADVTATKVVKENIEGMCNWSKKI